MAHDTSARPSELLNLKISDIAFKLSESGVQYSEIVVSGKTKSRTLPLIDCIPYLKEWLQHHPGGSNPGSWLFVSISKKNFSEKLSRDGLLAQYKYRYKRNFFPKLLEDDTVPPRDKALIKSMFTKPFSLYVFRHSASEKSLILKESTLRDHAGWSMASKMPQVYLHYFGNESSNSLLETYGILKKSEQTLKILKSKICPHCSESNKPQARCCTRCKMVLSYDTYKETIEEQKKNEDKLSSMEKQFNIMQSQLQILITSLGSIKDQSQINQTAQMLYKSGILNSPQQT